MLSLGDDVSCTVPRITVQPGPGRQLSALDGGQAAAVVVAAGHHALLGAAVAVQDAAEAGVRLGQGAHAGGASWAEARAAQLHHKGG